MRMRTLVLVGISSLALAVSPAFVPDAGAFVSKRPPVSLGAHFKGKAAAPSRVAATGKCRTAFGTPLSSPMGILAWNDESGTNYDTAGAADFRCAHNSTKKQRTIHKVVVNGYDGDPGSSRFNVTFYRNLNAEPNDNAVLCATQMVTGAPTGSEYPVNDTTTITLSKACVAKPGVNWVSVQELSGASMWYWEVQEEQQGFAPDWRDVHEVLRSGCTTWNNGRYEVDCLGFHFGDYMLILH